MLYRFLTTPSFGRHVQLILADTWPLPAPQAGQSGLARRTPRAYATQVEETRALRRLGTTGVTLMLLGAALASGFGPWFNAPLPPWSAWAVVGAWELWQWLLLGFQPRAHRGTLVVWAAALVSLAHLAGRWLIEAVLSSFAT